MVLITINQILTEEEMRACIKLYAEAKPGTFAKRCCKEIVEPILPRINAKLGQENDAMFLAYVIEFAFIDAGNGGSKGRRRK